MSVLQLDPATMLVLAVVLVVLFIVIFVATRLKRCPSNRILVIFGKVAGKKSSQCIHGGAAFVWPLIQDYAFLDLYPRTIEIELTGALSLKNIRVNVPSTFTVGISTSPIIMSNAAERLLGLSEKQIRDQASDIILGQMRLVIATLSIEEINQDREKFLSLVNDNVGTELAKIGLEVINVNIRDITDESGYIEAIGKKAAAEAVNQARIEVAQAEQKGATGEAEAHRIKAVSVAQETARSTQGQKAAEKDQRIAVASLEADAIQGQKLAERNQDIAVAKLHAEAVQGQKEAERTQRVAVSLFESEAVSGENKAKATIAQVNAELAEKEATSKRLAEVARAEAERAIFEAQKAQELARLAKDEVAQKEINKLKAEIDADAEAERIRRVALGEADRIMALRRAEAEGQRAILDAKAAGYLNLIKACQGRQDLVPTLLMIEKVTEVVAEQVKAVQNLKIDKITVWDGGRGTGNGPGGGSATANFLSSLVGSLPPMHELARQAGIELPAFLGRLDGAPESEEADAASTTSSAAPKARTKTPEPRRGGGEKSS